MTYISKYSTIKTALTIIAVLTGTVGHNAFVGTAYAQPAAQALEVTVHHGQGTLNNIKDNRIVDLTHGPIEPLGMPGMRMNFKVSDKIDLSTFTAGDKVDFNVIEGDNGWYVIIKLEKI